MENFDANLTRRAAGVSPPVLFCFVSVLSQPGQLSEKQFSEKQQEPAG
jgi:hypothetical protein